jgi:hypothetical protein
MICRPCRCAGRSTPADHLAASARGGGLLIHRDRLRARCICDRAGPAGCGADALPIALASVKIDDDLQECPSIRLA